MKTKRWTQSNIKISRILLSKKSVTFIQKRPFKNEK